MSEYVSLSSVLDELVPAVADEAPDWNDVLLRVRIAEATNRPAPKRVPTWSPSPRRPRVYALAGALTLALVMVAAALAAGGLHRFTAWVTGAPGTPAPASDRAGFARRNAAAFARFPAGTQLRLLARAAAGGKTFNLLGFRDGDALCLRVVRADLPAGRGSTQCASLLELERSVAPAVVVSDAWFSFGKPATSADGIYGFADDTVQKIEVVRERSGTHAVDVSSNAFLSLAARPSGSVANHPAPDPITGVFAVLRSGARIRLAYVSSGGVGTQAPPPKPPFYLAAPRISLAQIPGPAKVGQPFTGGTIAWVFGQQPHGQAFVVPRRDQRELGTTVFARTVQPDPNRPDKVALMLVRLAPRPFGPHLPTKPVLCFSSLQPLERLSGLSCAGVSGPARKPALPFRAGTPIIASFMWPTQLSHVAGIAADAVASLKAFLANGRVIPIPIRDNAFIADVPQSIPSKFVAYDNHGRVIGITSLGGGALRYQACPRYQPAARPILPPRAYERLNLATGQLNGHTIIGASEQQVTAALGKPEHILHNTITNGVRIPDYIYGGSRAGLPGTTQIQFGKHGTRIVAVSMSFQTNRLTDPKLGKVLATDPRVLQPRIQRSYPSYQLTNGYGTLDAHGCQFTFNRGHFRTHLMMSEFLLPQRPSQIVLTLRNGY